MIIEIILANNNKERYKISIKNKPSIKESELAIPNKLLTKKYHKKNDFKYIILCLQNQI